MKTLLVDNGSLEPAAHEALRRAAAAIAGRAGTPVEAVSWKHSNRVTAESLRGGRAWTLGPWIRAQVEAGEREYLIIPYFDSPQGAIGSALRRDLEDLRDELGGFDFSFTDGLSSGDGLTAIVTENVRRACVSQSLARPAVVVVDHGGPSRASAAVRDRTADAVRAGLGNEVGRVAAASMESPDGAEFSFNLPLLAEVLAAAGFDSGDVVIAPLFLSPGRHAGPAGDLARIARGAEARAPALRCHFAELVGSHPAAAELLADALARALNVGLHFMSDTPETAAKPLSKNEGLKAESNYLRGHILRDLEDTSTGTITEDSSQLTKFHGIYAQDDRDLRAQRRKEGKEKAYSFMARIRVPGGVCTPAQWLAMDTIADNQGNGTLKITNRQAFQLHGVIKGKLRPAIREVNRALMDTLAACGDVVRNVMCNPNPHLSRLHGETLAIAKAVSAHLSPRTRAYHEIWVDETLVAGGEPAENQEPIYGKTYLPRKFKIVFAIPPSNDVDVYAHDLGFIAVTNDDGSLAGFNVTVGGGMGMSHNQIETYPRLADVLGFCRPEQVVEVAEAIVAVQRDFGDRTDRKHARFKYTVADRGLVWIRQEAERRLGWELGTPRRFEFTDTGDRYGWTQGPNGDAHFTLFIENGRVKDATKTAVREIAAIHKGDFRLTPNQHLMIASITPADRPRIEALLREHVLDTAHRASGLRLNAMACVALPTCGLALAESERYLPDLVTQLDAEVEAAGLRDDAIVIRMTGCPNGCGRPFLAEIGFVGKAPGKYNMYLGAAFNGSRLNALYKPSVASAEIVELVRPLFRRYAAERLAGERFGDFVIRVGIVHHTGTAADFHGNPQQAPKPAGAGSGLSPRSRGL